MKKKATKGARKAKVRDLPVPKKAAGRVKAGATGTTVQTKASLQLDSCWIEGQSSVLRG